MNNTNFKKLINAAELVRLRWRPHGWLLWQMVPQGGITLLAGETSSGKTLLGLDLALGLASGRGRAWDMEIGEQVTGSREQVTGNWDQDTDNSGQVTGNWDQDTDNSEQVTGNREQDTKPMNGERLSPPSLMDSHENRGTIADSSWLIANREQVTGSRDRVTGNRDQDTDNSGQVTGNREQDTDNSEQVTGNRDKDARPTREERLSLPSLMNSHQNRETLADSSWPIADKIPFPAPRSPVIASAAKQSIPRLLPSPPRSSVIASAAKQSIPCPLPSPPRSPVIASAAKQSTPCPLPSDPHSSVIASAAKQSIPCPLLPEPCPARVRYFCADADPNLMAERMLRLCRGYPNGKKGMGIEVPRALDLDFSPHQFSDPESFAWLQKEVIRKGYHLLIFDGLSQYLPGMADGSARTVGAFLQGLRQLASQTGVTILLIHQFNKRQAARIDKWGLPTSQGEERVRGSSELLAGVDSVLLLSRPEAIKLGGMGRALLKVVKNRLGQAGARLQFTIVDGENSLHLLFERLAQQAQPKPRRLVDAALDEMMRILMEQDQRKFDRAQLTKLLRERMNLPGSRTLAEAFGMLGKEERVRVERKENGRRLYSWANPGTGAMEKIVYGLPPAMALDLASSYLLSKARLNQVDQQWEKLQKKNKPSELEQRLADFMKEVEEEGKER